MTSLPRVSSQGTSMPPIADMLTMGKGFSSVSPSSSAAASTVAHAMAIHRLWLRGTPLGSATVPEVQQMVYTSLAETGCAAA